jgi:hypothetical protein
MSLPPPKKTLYLACTISSFTRFLLKLPCFTRPEIGGVKKTVNTSLKNQEEILWSAAVRSGQQPLHLRCPRTSQIKATMQNRSARKAWPRAQPQLAQLEPGGSAEVRGYSRYPAASPCQSPSCTPSPALSLWPSCSLRLRASGSTDRVRQSAANDGRQHPASRAQSSATCARIFPPRRRTERSRTWWNCKRRPDVEASALRSIGRRRRPRARGRGTTRDLLFFQRRALDRPDSGSAREVADERCRCRLDQSARGDMQL